MQRVMKMCDDVQREDRFCSFRTTANPNPCKRKKKKKKTKKREKMGALIRRETTKLQKRKETPTGACITPVHTPVFTVETDFGTPSP